MKSSLAVLSVACLPALFIACSPSATESSAADSVAVAQASISATASSAMCMVTELGLRDSPGEKGKYLTTIYLSERFTLTGDTATAGDKKVNYHKVKLEDGKEGWVRTDFIAIDMTPAVFTATTTVNVRPDIAAVSGKQFSRLDLVATKASTTGWFEVKGNATGEKGLVSGYIHGGGNMSSEPIDISFAAIYHRAQAQKDEKKKKDLMNLLATSQDFQQSAFYAGEFGTDMDGTEGEDMAPFASFTFDGHIMDDFRNVTFENRGVTYTENRYGDAERAANFNQGVLISQLLPDNQEMSYALWVKLHSANETTILGMGNNCSSGYSILVEPGGKLGILCGGVAVNVTNSGFIFPVDKWTHICLVKRGSDFSLYVNGKLSSRGSSSYNNLTSAFTIGAGSGCNGPAIGGYAAGAIDGLYIYQRAISDEEIRNMFYMPSGE